MNDDQLSTLLAVLERVAETVERIEKQLLSIDAKADAMQELLRNLNRSQWG